MVCLTFALGVLRLPTLGGQGNNRIILTIGFAFVELVMVARTDYLRCGFKWGITCMKLQHIPSVAWQIEAVLKVMSSLSL